MIPGLPPASERTLNEWYDVVNRIYLDRNLDRDPFAIFGHLVEVVGGLSVIGNAPRRRKPEFEPSSFVPKALAWWMALCGRVGVLDLEEMVWTKFPGVCTYCMVCPHDAERCATAKRASRTPDWRQLKHVADQKAGEKPSGMGGWLDMFARIYPPADEQSLAAGFSRFTEELGELAEALRVLKVAPGYFLSEASDVFAWLMHIQIRIYWGEDVTEERGARMVDGFTAAYPDACRDCGQLPCSCRPILSETIGRLAHEGPPDSARFFGPGLPIPTAEVARLLSVESRRVTVGDQDFLVNQQLVRQVNESMSTLLASMAAGQVVAESNSQALAEAAESLRALAAAQELTQASIDALAEAVAALPKQERDGLLRFLEGVNANMWTEALVSAVRLAAGGG